MLNNKKKSTKIIAILIFGVLILSNLYGVIGTTSFGSSDEIDGDTEALLDTEIPIYDDTPIIDTGVELIDFTGEEVFEPDNYDRNAIEWRPIEESVKNIQFNDDVVGASIATASYDAITGVERIINPQFLPSPESMPELSVVEPYAGLLTGTIGAEAVIGTDDRAIVDNSVYPWRTVVKLYISAADGSNWVGSGAIIDNFHVLTAGHCAFLPDNGGWASNIEIVPGMDTSDTPSDPYGHAWATTMRSYTGWTVSESSQHDWALLTLDRNVGAFTGWMGRITAGSSSSIYDEIMNVAGYPTDLSGGNRMYWDSDWGDGATTNNHFYWADTAGGMSGGPVWRLVSGNRYIMTVHAYGRGGTDSNFGTRLNNDKYDRLFTWLGEDSAPTDKADLIDRGSSYDSATGGTWQSGVTSVTITNGIRNVGTSSSGTYYVHYYASTNDYISEYDYYIGTSTAESTGAFGTDSATFTGVLPGDIPAGVYYIGWIIDKDDTVDEFDETNNKAVYAYQRTILGAPPPSGYIEVTVRDSSTNNFISSAYVSVKDDTATVIDTGYTDGSGFYNVTGLDVGWYTIDVSKVGYQPQQKMNYINWDGDDDYLYFYLVPQPPDSSWIEVNVKDSSTSNPISSAYVQVVNMSSGLVIQTGYTSGAGFYNATGLYIGWYEVTVSKVGYATQTKQNYINWNYDDDYLTFYLVQKPIDSGYIEVRVYNETGDPKQSVFVECYHDNGTFHDNGFTDSSGFFNITGLVIGWYVVNVSHVGYYEQSKSDYINWRGDDDYLSFYLANLPPDSGYIDVTVYDSVSYLGISSAYVVVTNQSSGLVIDTGYTDSSGFYKVTGLTIGWYTVEVSRSGYYSQTKQTYINWAGDDDYLIYYMDALPPDSGYIEVKAYDADTYNPIQSAYVSCLYNNGTVFTTGYTDSSGFFNITGLIIGWYTVEVSKAGYKATIKSNYINWNGDDDYLTFYLLPMPPDSGYIEVRVYDGTTYIPVENANVECFNTTTGTLVFSGSTDSSGFVNITGLYVGWLTVNVTHAIYERQSKDNYINWNGDDDYLYFYLTKLQTFIIGPVAIFRDRLPWNLNMTEPILKANGVSYTLYDSLDFGSVSLGSFQKVIIPSDQTQTFYDRLNTNRAWFENYVSNGGILELHACDRGWGGGNWDSYTMPGGLNKTYLYLQNVSIINPTHPLLHIPYGVEDDELDGWFYSAHGYFDDYPINANEILNYPVTSNPVLLEFAFGSGFIIASMQTLEWNQNLNYTKLLENIILYNPLAIPDSIIMLNPTGAASWQNGTIHTLTWATTGNITNVKIELYRDGVYLMDIAASTPCDDEYIWNIPGFLSKSTQYQIKISNVDKSTTYVFSNHFEIWTDTITLTSPTSLDSWEAGMSHLITWNKTGDFDNVRILLYENNINLMEVTASTPNDGEFNWAIPFGLLDSLIYQIVIMDADYPNTVDTSDYFEIYNPSIDITAPGISDLWDIGSTRLITWNSRGTITDVIIELYENGLFIMEITASTPNDGSHSWTLPLGLSDSTLYQIKVIDANNNDTYDMSEYFVIEDLRSITVTIPDSTTAWETGSTYNIMWTSTGSIANVTIELYASSILVMELAASTLNDGTFEWTIPSTLLTFTTYVIRISDALDPNIYDDSDPFSLTKPPGGPDDIIPGYDLLILCGLLLGISFILVKRKRKKATLL